MFDLKLANFLQLKLNTNLIHSYDDHNYKKLIGISKIKLRTIRTLILVNLYNIFIIK